MGRKDIITKSSDRILVPWGASSSDDTFPRRGTMQKTEQSLTGPHRLNTQGQAPGYATMLVIQRDLRTPQSRGASASSVNASGRTVVVKQ